MLRAQRFWAWPSELRSRGVLGINNRNVGYLFELNPRKHYPRVDDKIISKELCVKHGIPVPDTYAVIEMLGDARRYVNKARAAGTRAASGRRSWAGQS